jgi:ABC-type nitrate/sulfonate/bicarbonate transport system permease component
VARVHSKPEVTEGIAETTPAPHAGAGSLGVLLLHPLVLRALSLAIVLVAWEWAGRVPISPSFPTFLETVAAIIGMIGDGSLPSALAITVVPLAIGLVISACVGVAVGVAMGLDTRVEWLGVPIFVVMQAAPLAALVPLLVLAYGIGLATKVLIVCIMALPVIVLNAFKAIRHTPVSLIDMGRAFLGTRAQLIAKIILPSAAPVIFAGLRLGAASGFVGAILAELLVTPTGIGDIITYNQSIAEYPKMYGAIATVIVLSVICIEGLEWAERRYFRPEKRGGQI